MWSNNLAYAIGLITSDGCLNKDGRHIWFSSKEIQLIETFKKSLLLSNKIGKYARGGETEKRYFCITLGDICFYKFLLSIASASLDFLTWLKNILTKFYGVKGYIHKGDGVWNLEYVKGDTKKLFWVMYYSKNILRLDRKYCKVRDAIAEDAQRGLVYLQKQRTPR